jgi:hypothetical protein
MPWRDPLPAPIRLIDGARILLVAEDLYHQPGTRDALELLLEASQTGDQKDIQAATNQVIIVLGQRKLLA